MSQVWGILLQIGGPKQCFNVATNLTAYTFRTEHDNT